MKTKSVQDKDKGTGAGAGMLWSWANGLWHYAPQDSAKRLNRHDMRRAARRMVSCAPQAAREVTGGLFSPGESALAREFVAGEARKLEFTAAGLLATGTAESGDIDRAAVAAVLNRLHALHAWAGARGLTPANDSGAGRPALSRREQAARRLVRMLQRRQALAERAAVGAELARLRGARTAAEHAAKADATKAKAEAKAAGVEFLPLQASRRRRDKLARVSLAAHAAGEVARAGSARAARGVWGEWSPLARGIYRRAAAMADRFSKRWVAANAVGSFALPSWARGEVKRRDGSSRVWGFETRGAGSEHSGNQGDDLRAGELLLAEVGAIYRQTFLALVPRLLVRLQRGRGCPGQWRVSFRIARRLALKRAAKAAAAFLYRAKGRDGREVNAFDDVLTNAEGAQVRDGRGVADELRTGATLPRAESSDVREVRRGEAGRRPSVAGAMADAVAAAMMEAAREAAEASKGGKGAGPKAAGAAALMATAQAVAVASLGGSLTEADRAGLAKGEQGGISKAWSERASRFCGAAGLERPKAAEMRERAAKRKTAKA